MTYPIQKLDPALVGQHLEVSSLDGPQRGVLTYTKVRIEKTEIPAKRGTITERRYTYDVHINGRPVRTTPGSVFRILSKEEQ